MKKTILGLVLILSFMLSSAAAVYADSTDPKVQEAQGYIAKMDAAMAAGPVGLEDLEKAYDDYEALGLTYEQAQELTNAEWTTVVNAGSVTAMYDLYEPYTIDQNARTAMHFVDYYTSFTDPDMLVLFETMMPGIGADYTIATGLYPSEDVLKVYEAYLGVRYALDFWAVTDDTRDAVEDFNAVLDIFNELSGEDFEVLAELIGVEDADAAFAMILNDWIHINVIVELDDVYQAYMTDPNEETAKALVDYYDSIYFDDSYADVELRELVKNFFIDIDDVYGEAKALLAEAESKPAPEPEPAEKAPATADGTSFLPLAGLLAAAGALAALRKKQA